MSEKLELVGLGNALVDALVLVEDDAVLEKEGLERGSMHLVDHERWESVYSAVPPEAVTIRPGGSAANAVVTFALLGGQATFRGQVGDDPLGAMYREKMVERTGNNHLHFGDGNTGKCLSIVSERDAERTMVTDLGCASGLPHDAQFAKEIGDARFLHLTGYAFTGGAIGDTARKALDAARAAGTRVCFDLADPFVVRAHREEILDLARNHAQVVFLNEEEAHTLTEGDPADALSMLGGPGRVVALKLGSKGSVVHADGRMYPVEPVPVEAKDSTGAGDAYAGAFLFGAARGMDWQQCGRLASRVAAQVVTQLGSVVEDTELLQAALHSVS